MSIFGSSSYNSPYNLNLKALPNLYTAGNVVRDIHFKNMIDNVKAEFMEFVDVVLGKCARRGYTWIVGDENAHAIDNTSPLHRDAQMNRFIDTFMSRADHSMYYLEGYHIPLNLTNLALQNMRDAEYVATYYCKFDTSPLPVYDVTNELSYLKNIIRMPYIYSERHFKEDKSIAKWFYNYPNESRWYSPDNDEQDKKLRHLNVPKVRVNTWKIPIFTDGHYNSVSFIRDLDVQIDFMPSPLSNDYFTKNMESSYISVTGRGLFPGEDLEGQEFDPSVGVYHTINGQFIGVHKTASPGNFETAVKRYVYSLNKRPNRHCRYRVSAYGYATKPNFPGIEETFPARWVNVEKVYDTEAEFPMSFGYNYCGSNASNDNLGIVPEGIAPDPEDLTNPMDIAVDFEFVQCKVDENFNPIDTHHIEERTPKTLFGYLILRAYSGIVGSTLQDGVYDKEAITAEEPLANPYTSYDVKTRPHDVFFKVTLRTPKHQKSVGGNFYKIRRRNETDIVEDMDDGKKWGWLKDNKLDPNKIKVEFNDIEKMQFLDSRISFDSNLEGAVYFAPTLSQIKTNEIFKDTDKTPGFIRPSFMTSYEKSPDLRWGEYDFYRYRIKDNGGYLRPPMDDILDFMYMVRFSDMHRAGVFSGYVNIGTMYLECVEYKNDNRLQSMLNTINVGGKCLGGVMK